MPALSVLDSWIAYSEHGSGAPVILLHGNPTSSFLWRHVSPRLAEQARVLAPDLIGMGASGKPRIAYTFDDHARYLAAWIDGLGLDEVVLVGHDWGGALALDWAATRPDRVRGIAVVETILRPLSWDGLPDATRTLFTDLRAPGRGETLVLEENRYIEQALPRGVLRGLADAELARYRQPFPTVESRRPILAWIRSLPFDGEPADVTARVRAYDAWLATSPQTPRLLLACDPAPGLLIGPDTVEWARRELPGLEIASIGRAGHHAPEDRPDAIAEAVGAWLDRHGLSAPRG